MNSDNVLAVSGAVIAVAALAVSVYQSWVTRDHNRRSVRPLLRLRLSLRTGQTAGIRLTNSGLGPALITKAMVWLDGKSIGPYSEDTSNVIRGDQRPRPSATTLTPGDVLATDYDQYILAVADFDLAVDWHAAFTNLVRERLVLEIHYTSLYEERSWTARWPTHR